MKNTAFSRGQRIIGNDMYLKSYKNRTSIEQYMLDTEQLVMYSELVKHIILTLVRGTSRERATRTTTGHYSQK